MRRRSRRGLRLAVRPAVRRGDPRRRAADAARSAPGGASAAAGAPSWPADVSADVGRVLRCAGDCVTFDALVDVLARWIVGSDRLPTSPAPAPAPDPAPGGAGSGAPSERLPVRRWSWLDVAPRGGRRRSAWPRFLLPSLAEAFA